MDLKFPACGPIGLYPIVDSLAWVQFLLPLGVKTLQLRIKNTEDPRLETQIKTSIQLAEYHQAQLFINDHWALALKHGAFGVHLGQEDLDTADLSALAQAGLRLGISTHNAEEITRAKCLNPSYLAFGPIFPTTSKVMRFAPQGLALLAHWRQTLNDITWVAIGGITLDNAAAVWATGVEGVALISAISQAPDPGLATQKLRAILGA